MANPVRQVDDEEDVAGQFADEPDEGDDEDELEGGGDTSLEGHEAKLRKTIGKRINTYKENSAARLQAFLDKQEAWFQRRMDEYALKTVGDGTVSINNPEQLAESIARQVAETEKRLAELTAMAQKLQSMSA